MQRDRDGSELKHWMCCGEPRAAAVLLLLLLSVGSFGAALCSASHGGILSTSGKTNHTVAAVVYSLTVASC